MKQSKQPMPLVSIVIVTFNAEQYIRACIQSIFDSTYTNIEVIVVDNCSTDATRTIVKQFPKITLLEPETNIGYAGGNNFGAAHAKGTYICVLNPDTIVHPHFLEPMVKALESQPYVAACQPAVYLLNEPKVLNLTGKVTHFLGFDWIRDYKSKSLPSSSEIVSLSGSCFVIRTELFKQVSGFDESFFLYFEDSDLSWKLRLLGFTLQFCEDSSILHDYKFVPNPNTLQFSKKIYYYERNRLLMLYKNYSYKTLLLIFPILVFSELGMVVYSIISGTLLAKLQSYIGFLKAIRLVSQSRDWIQQNRIKSDREIIATFADIISFEPFLNPATRFILNPACQLYYKFLLAYV